MAPPLLCPVTKTGLLGPGLHAEIRVCTRWIIDVVALKNPLWTWPGTRLGPLGLEAGTAKKFCSQSSQLSGSVADGGSVPRNATTMPNGHCPTVAALMKPSP